MDNGYERRHFRLRTATAIYVYLHIVRIIDNFKMKECTVPCEINYTTGLGFRHPCDLVSPPLS